MNKTDKLKIYVEESDYYDDNRMFSSLLAFITMEFKDLILFKNPKIQINIISNPEEEVNGSVFLCEDTIFVESYYNNVINQHKFYYENNYLKSILFNVLEQLHSLKEFLEEYNKNDDYTLLDIFTNVCNKHETNLNEILINEDDVESKYEAIFNSPHYNKSLFYSFKYLNILENIYNYDGIHCSPTIWKYY